MSPEEISQPDGWGCCRAELLADKQRLIGLTGLRLNTSGLFLKFIESILPPTSGPTGDGRTARTTLSKKTITEMVHPNILISSLIQKDSLKRVLMGQDLLSPTSKRPRTENRRSDPWILCKDFTEEGGILQNPWTDVKLTVPPGAVQKGHSVAIRVKVFDDPMNYNDGIYPDETILGPVVEMEANRNNVLQYPAKLSIPFCSTLMNPSDVIVMYGAGGCFEHELNKTSYEVRDNFVNILTDTFTTFRISGHKEGKETKEVLHEWGLRNKVFVPLLDLGVDGQWSICEDGPKISLQTNWTKLIKVLPMPDLWDRLVGYGVLTEDQVKSCQASGTDEKVVANFLDLLNKGPVSHIHGFLKVLADTDNDHLITMLGYHPSNYACKGTSIDLLMGEIKSSCNDC